ncbi:unnamed protein product [Rhizophagus irregularis]|nr:unnamed protein product [Rhizophagus irregularis]
MDTRSDVPCITHILSLLRSSLSFPFFHQILFFTFPTSDSDSFSRDVEFFTNDFTENIPDDSDDEDEDFYSYNMSGSALTLNVGLSFHTWKAAFQHINNGLINKVFVRKGR